MQELIVSVICLLTLVFVVRYIWRSMKGKNNACSSCSGSCKGCLSNKKK